MPAIGPRLPILATAAALVALAAFPAAAQDPDGAPGCVEANPCDLILAVDADGFADVSETEFTHMDWLVATIINHDDVDHTVTLASHDLTVTVPAGDLVDSDPFRINAAGSYTLSDEPTGDSVEITSVAEEEFEGDSADGDEESNGIPTFAPLAVLALFLAVAAVASRRD